MSKVKYFERMIYILQTYPSKSFQNNMFKATNFAKNKLRQRCFHDALQKLSQADTFDSSFNGWLVLRQLT